MGPLQIEGGWNCRWSGRRDLRELWHLSVASRLAKSLLIPTSPKTTTLAMIQCSLKRVAWSAYFARENEDPLAETPTMEQSEIVLH
jgi:hypothetical protein